MNKSSITGAIAAGVVTFAGVSLGVNHSTPRAQAAPSAAVQRCTNVQLLIRPYKSLGGAAGHLGLWYRLHNLSAAPCSLYGYPGLLLLDRNFQTLPTKVQRAHGYIVAGTVPVRQVVLNQQHDGYFALEYTDVPTGNAPCPTPPYAMITPPNDRLPDVTYSGMSVFCGGRVVVSPIEPSLSWQ
jgi:hypothetical protein